MRMLIFFCILTLVSDLIDGKEWTNQQKNKKYFFSVCAIVKNEAKFIKEWIEFHRIIGVDHFYLYDNNSFDNLSKLLRPYIQEKIVTLTHWPDFLGTPCKDMEWALSTQVSAFENAIKVKGVNTKWLAILNIDEYLVPLEPYSLKELLQQCDSYPGVLLTTDVFDGSAINLFPPNRMVVQSRELIKSPKQNIMKSFVKLIFKPNQCAGFIWPPYQIVFKNNQKPFEINRSFIRINHYVNRNAEFIDIPYRKFPLNGKILSSSELSYFLEEGYVIEDPEQAIFRYIPELLERFEIGVQQ